MLKIIKLLTSALRNCTILAYNYTKHELEFQLRMQQLRNKNNL